MLYQLSYTPRPKGVVNPKQRQAQVKPCQSFKISSTKVTVTKASFSLRWPHACGKTETKAFRHGSNTFRQSRLHDEYDHESRSGFCSDGCGRPPHPNSNSSANQRDCNDESKCRESHEKGERQKSCHYDSQNRSRSADQLQRSQGKSSRSDKV